MYLRILLLSLLLSLISCTGLRPISANELESRHLVGEWTSGSDRMYIGCSGGLSYEIKPNKYDIVDFSGGSSTGGHVASIDNHSFTAGPFKKTFQVQRWPSSMGDSATMTVNNRVWHRAYTEHCSSR